MTDEPLQLDLFAFRRSLGAGTPEEIVTAVNAIRPNVTTLFQAQLWIAQLIRFFLETNRYRQAALVLWGPELFDVRPNSVGRILNAIESNSRVILLGSGASGKSYTICGYLLLTFLRDPSYTSIRVISTTLRHTKSNTFSFIHKFHADAIIPLPGIRQVEYIGMDDKERHTGISTVTVQEGESGKNSLQGTHTLRRQTPHPVFGISSRVLVFLDEAEMIPPGVWLGCNNILSSMQGVDSVKLIVACNPWNVSSLVGINSEPPKSWLKVDPDTDFDWISKRGFRVLRIDASQSENVKQKRVVHPGLMTFEGYENYRSKSDGKDAEYWCYARGMYPLTGTADQLIPISLLQDFQGEWIFHTHTVTGVGGCDLAVEGDDCILFIGRYGEASSYRDATGKVFQLEEKRFCYQLDQYFTLDKGLRIEAQYDNILQKCAANGIPTNMLAFDSTGVGHGLCDLMIGRGHRIMPIIWGSAATHTLIVQESRAHADERFSGIAAEMWFAVKELLEFGYLKILPHVSMDRLQPELIGRKQKRSGGLGKTGEPLFALEPKAAFKSRLGRSPDVADALAMCVHCARIRGPETPTMARKRIVRPPPRYDTGLDAPPYIDFSTD